MSRLIIYQLFVRHFSNYKQNQVLDGTLEQNGCGTFDGVTDKALAELKKLGVNTVWYTGVLEHATSTYFEGIESDPSSLLKGKAGSPFAVRDYFDVSPTLAKNVNNRMEEFESMVKRTKSAGLKCIIDFIPNHLARKYSSDVRPEIEFGKNDNSLLFFSRDNEYYYLEDDSEFWLPNGETFPKSKERHRVTGNNAITHSPNEHDWYETVKLNYGFDFRNQNNVNLLDTSSPVPFLWNKMRAILLYWAGKGIDGVRCDMAHLVPTAFWQWVIVEVRKDFPEFTFIGEAYADDPMGCLGSLSDLVDAGFDAYYDHDSYRHLREVAEHQAPAESLKAFFFDVDRQKYGVRYIENHDEVRSANPNYFGDRGENVAASAAAWLTGYGPVMLYNGQEVGEPAIGESGFSGNDGRTSIFDYIALPELQKWTNNGAFDGALLSEAQKDLRSDYQELLKFADLKVFREGETYGLNFLNNHLTEKGTFVFSRFIKGETIALVVANFKGETEEEVKVHFSAEALSYMGMGDFDPGELSCDVTGIKAIIHQDLSADFMVSMSGSVEVVQFAL